MQEYNQWAPNPAAAAAMQNASRARAQAVAAERVRVAAASAAARSESPDWDMPVNRDIWEMEPEIFKVRLAKNPEMVVVWLKEEQRIAPHPLKANFNSLWDPCCMWLKALYERIMYPSFGNISPRTTANVVHWMTTLPQWNISHIQMGGYLSALPTAISLEFVRHLASGETHQFIRDLVKSICNMPRPRQEVRSAVAILEYKVEASKGWRPISDEDYYQVVAALNQFDDADEWLMPLMVFMSKQMCRNRDPHAYNAWKQDIRHTHHAPREVKLFHAMLQSREAYEVYIEKNWRPEGAGRYTPKDFDPRIRPFNPTREYDSDIESVEGEPMDQDADEDAAYDANQTGPMQLLSEALHENTIFPAEISAMIMNMYLGQEAKPNPKLTDILRARHTALNAPDLVRKAEGEPEEEKENGAKRSKP